jgi:sugar/nucleoside kinase (ribokinase family)
VTRSVTIVGNVNADVVAGPLSELPPPGGDVLVDAIEVRVGGAAANAAMVLARLGLVPRLVGAVGDDQFGRFVLDSLRGMGLAGDVLVLPGVPTGVSICVEAPGRDRAFISVRGALDSFDAAMVPGDAMAASILLLCGYFTLGSLRGRPALALLERARSGGATVLLDPDTEAGGWSSSARREIQELLPLVDGFLPNEHEASGLAGLSDPVEAGRALQRRSGGWVVVKRGGKGAAAIMPDGGTVTVPAREVAVRDTTGAGDSFDAGVVLALSRGAALPEALALASRVAAAVISRPSGDRHPSPSDLGL